MPRPRRRKTPILRELPIDKLELIANWILGISDAEQNSFERGTPILRFPGYRKALA
jgi:hypothetical protein